ncbi:MAG: hypothetical protein R3D33_12490 [Hyphomicrobiaceae bacterium]
MWRFAFLSLLLASFWGASTLLPRADEERQLISVVGIAARGTPEMDGLGIAQGSRMVATPATLIPSFSGLASMDGATLDAALASPFQMALIPTAAAATTEGPITAVALSSITAPEPAVEPEVEDRPTLVRAIQRGLRRVGCYRGSDHGRWNRSTRAAILRYSEGSALPAGLDDPSGEPTALLLRAISRQTDRVCGASCGVGRAPDDDGHCVALSITASADPDGASGIVPDPADGTSPTAAATDAFVSTALDQPILKAESEANDATAAEPARIIGTADAFSPSRSTSDTSSRRKRTTVADTSSTTTTVGTTSGRTLKARAASSGGSTPSTWSKKRSALGVTVTRAATRTVEKSGSGKRKLGTAAAYRKWIRTGAGGQREGTR